MPLGVEDSRNYVNIARNLPYAYRRLEAFLPQAKRRKPNFKAGVSQQEEIQLDELLSGPESIKVQRLRAKHLYVPAMVLSRAFDGG